MGHLRSFYVGVVAFVLAFDWLSKFLVQDVYAGYKSLIPGLLDIQVLRNYGLFQGLFSQQAQHLSPWWGVLLAGLVCGAVGFGAWRTPSAKTLRHWGFACMIGGALSNGLDRAIHGYVLDFLQIGPLGVFNLADFAILGGAGLVILDIWRTRS